MQRVCLHFVLRLSLRLSRETLAEVFISIPLVHSTLFLRFSQILLYTNFCIMYITMQNTVFLTQMMLLIGERQPFFSLLFFLLFFLCLW